MHTKSPCRKPECKDKDRMACAENCPELKIYQEHVDAIHQFDAPPAIDYTEFSRFSTASATKKRTPSNE